MKKVFFYSLAILIFGGLFKNILKRDQQIEVDQEQERRIVNSEAVIKKSDSLNSLSENNLGPQVENKVPGTITLRSQPVMNKDVQSNASQIDQQFEQPKPTEDKSVGEAKDRSQKPAPVPVVIQPKDAKGGVYALYRAVLWRDPDAAGGQNATNLFSSIGWSTFIENSRNMISSPEFEERIAPNHDALSIINRIYSVFLGRCPSKIELASHFGQLKKNEPGQITEAVLRQTSQQNVKQIFLGGYNPNICGKVIRD